MRGIVRYLPLFQWWNERFLFSGHIKLPTWNHIRYGTVHMKHAMTYPYDSLHKHTGRPM
jgi:hypothetical protein